MPMNNKEAMYIAEHEGYSVRADADMETAELVLYGLVVKSRPFDYNTNKPTEEKYIVESEILDDLKAISKSKKLDIKLNSCGGSCTTAIVIYNKLREMVTNGTQITCTVDGVAMSAGSHIMCAADTVRASEGSLIMIHKSLTPVWGYYNADEFRKMAQVNDAYDNVMLTAYKRKTGKEEAELLSMMSAETFMTGSEAKEQGFVDELIETSNEVKIAASADKTALYVNGRFMPLHGAICPENIPVVNNAPHITETNNKAIEPKPNGEGYANKPKNEGGKTTMAGNLAELRKENPELAARVEEDYKAEYAAENKAATDAAVQKALADERTRLEKIEAIAGQVSPEFLADAKYKNPCTAEELAYKAMSENAKKGKSFLDDMNADYTDSGAGKIHAVAPQPDGGAAQTEAQKQAEVLAAIDEALKEDDE